MLHRLFNNYRRNRKQLHNNINVFNEEHKKKNTKINIQKIKTMMTGRSEEKHNIELIENI